MSANLTAPARRRAGRLLNAAIALMTLVVAGLLVRGSFSAPPGPPALAPSARIFVEGIDWAKSEQTLLVAVRADCAYCTRSGRFYRRLLEGLGGRTDARAVFIYPDDAARGEAYLMELGLAPAESSRQRLAPLGIQNVPTLALVGSDGKVSRVWVGELSPKKESEVLAALRFEDTRAVAEWTIDEAGLGRRLAAREPLVIVDLRQRGAYMNGHPAGAKNLPWDEIYARAKNELPQDRTVVLYGDDEIQADVAYSDLFRLGYKNVLVYAGDPLPAGPTD
jgi:rhodanese-related sulfurtransferase